ncbi:hypothetical protein F4811DRAFT_572379 [Daldinia bambusicola]|nr:hypothetical protein F4811DRAFT_572379 [Daldinia bambusicola]
MEEGHATRGPAVDYNVSCYGGPTLSGAHIIFPEQDALKTSAKDKGNGLHSQSASGPSATGATEFGTDVCQRTNGVLAQSENQSFQSDHSLSSSKKDESFSSSRNFSLPSLSAETQESASSSMWREDTPLDMLFELPRKAVFSDDFELSGFASYEHRDGYNTPQYYQNLSHEDDTDQPLTMSIPKKADHSGTWGMDTMNRLFEVTSSSSVDHKLDTSSCKDIPFSKLNSTSVNEHMASTSTTHGDSSPGWNTGIDSKRIKNSCDEPKNVPRQKNCKIKTSKEVPENGLNHSSSSPLPSAFTTSHPSSLGNSSNVTEYDSTNSSDFEDELNYVDHGVLQPLRPLIIDELLETFFKTLSLSRYKLNEAPSGSTASRPQCCKTAQKQSEPASKNATTSSRGKRRRKYSDQHQSGDEDEDEDEDRNPKKRPRLDRPVEVQPTFWACPFSKWKPLSYRKCCQYILKDISRVKQHLRRYHERPPYCPVCWEVFPEDGFESHIQSRSCSPRPKADLEGVTSAQQKQLERRSDKQLTKPKQWYAIYDILFPGQKHPKSPYLESDLSSELLTFQVFMATDGLQIVQRAAREHIPHDLMPLQGEVLAFSQTLFQQAIPQILRRYDATRPVHDTPEIPKKPGLSPARGNDCDSGYGTLSHTSHERDSGNKEQDGQEAQDLTIADGIDYTSFDLVPGGDAYDAQVQALWTKGHVTAGPVQSHNIRTVDTGTPIALENPTASYAHLDLPSGFALDNFDEQLFALGGAARGFDGGQDSIWEATFIANLENDGSSTSTGQI